MNNNINDLIEITTKNLTKVFKDLELYDLVPSEHILETPNRIAKMWVNELFSGLYEELGEIKTFSCKDAKAEVMVGPCSIKSTCAHHFVPFKGEMYVTYMPKNKVIGLSKFSRVADYFSRKPQIQEILTNEIGNYLVDILDPDYLIIVIKAEHLCMTHRGVNENSTNTITTYIYNSNNDGFSINAIKTNMIGLINKR